MPLFFAGGVYIGDDMVDVPLEPYIEVLLPLRAEEVIVCLAGEGDVPLPVDWVGCERRTNRLPSTLGEAKTSPDSRATVLIKVAI